LSAIGAIGGFIGPLLVLMIYLFPLWPFLSFLILYVYSEDRDVHKVATFGLAYFLALFLTTILCYAGCWRLATLLPYMYILATLLPYMYVFAFIFIFGVLIWLGTRHKSYQP